jgi:carbonic anhydrase
MNRRIADRRRWLACAGAVAVAPTLASASMPGTLFPSEAIESFDKLKAGNIRFMEGKTLHAHESANWRKHLVQGQKPFATILGCSDSRVPVELVFDQGLGDLFVVRVAGNVIAPDVVGSLEYAVEHLNTPLLIVMGHEGCGAVTAAVDALGGPMNELTAIKNLVDLIEPGLPRDLGGDSKQERVNNAVEHNVRWSLKQLARMPETKAQIDSRKVTVLGAVYELGSGRVRFL